MNKKEKTKKSMYTSSTEAQPQPVQIQVASESLNPSKSLATGTVNTTS